MVAEIRPEVTGFDEHLGLTLSRIDGDGVDGQLRVSPALHQPHGIVHGGVYCTVVETAASIAGATWFGERGTCVGVSNHTNFLRAVREGVLDVRARPLQRGRTQQLWRVTIVDDDGRNLAVGEVRLANIPNAADIGS